MTLNPEAHVLRVGEGRTLSFLSSRVTVKVETGDSGPCYSLLELTIQPGAAPLPHVHLHEDEGFYILDGTVIFQCGDTVHRLGPGGFVLLPRGVAHSCEVDGDTAARVLVLCSARGFASFAIALGTPIDGDTVAQAQRIDPAILVAVAAEHGIEIRR